jgi:hypothetical protein
MIELMHLAPADMDNIIVEIPVEVHSVLKEFQNVFATPSDLPPRRACDHNIPLIPGVSPVFFRPYKYAPAMKDEIEKQVTEMLQTTYH